MRQLTITFLHFAYWSMYIVLLLSFFLILVINGKDQHEDIATIWWIWSRLIVGFAVVPAVIGFYFGYIVGFPRLLARQKTKRFILFSLLATLGASLAGGITMSIIYQRNTLFVEGWQSAIPQLVFMWFIGVVNLTLGCIIRGFIQSTRDIRIKAKLEHERLEAELHLMRIQVNPHFLFNTLNNIDALIRISPEQASNYLHRLSHFMRQLVYETDDTLHPLDRELMVLEDYLALQQIRFKSEEIFRWQREGNTEDMEVPPLIALPLIENAFKHGRIDAQHPITITACVQALHTEIRITNAIDSNAPQSPGGLGLELTRKRLQAAYGDRAQCIALVQDHQYIQTLLIQRQP